MTADRLILFDIDGTLLSAGRSGYFALERAAIEILGAMRGLEGIILEGNTDSRVLYQISQRDGTSLPSKELLSRFKKLYVEILKKEIVGKGHLKPGIPDLLKMLAKKKNVQIGLVTGNFREGAEIKLQRFGIREYFSFGAFGCEHAERSELVRFAMERASRLKEGKAYLAKNVVMVGDTVHDVIACRPWGIRSLAVATGSTSRGELAEAGADLAIDDLANVDQIIKWLRCS
ncbi:MAG: HAD family hydrolase [Candidatus Riflebacteria bacterium]|nr:HAD family hydrolase [Candidatus Riflebacteria bacterium]